MNTGKFPVGLSTCGSKPLDEPAFIRMKEAGIDALELSAPDFDGFDFPLLQTLAQRHGICLWSMHLPFLPFSQLELSDPDAALRNQTIACFRELIGRGAGAGIDKFVVHPSGEPIADADRPDRLKYAMDSLDQLARIAEVYGAVIAVEDLPRTCLGNTWEEILQLISPNPRLGVCFDVNHLLTEDNCDFIRHVGSRIITTHISDYDFVDEKHWLPGEGDIDWLQLHQALREIDYPGVWMYELGLEPPRTLERRRLTYADFRENADSIFRGTAPAPIGTRK